MSVCVCVISMCMNVVFKCRVLTVFKVNFIVCAIARLVSTDQQVEVG